MENKLMWLGKKSQMTEEIVENEQEDECRNTFFYNKKKKEKKGNPSKI